MDTTEVSIVETLKLHPLERPPNDFKDHGGIETSLNERPIAPDQFIEGYEATKWEVWAFYLFFTGNSGLGLFSFAPTALQNLLYRAADDNGLLRFAGRLRSINSIILLSNGISFSIQTVLFLILGSYADFGNWRPWILIVWTALGIMTGFSWLGVSRPNKWEIGVGLYTFGRQ